MYSSRSAPVSDYASLNSCKHFAFALKMLLDCDFREKATRDDTWAELELYVIKWENICLSMFLRKHKECMIVSDLSALILLSVSSRIRPCFVQVTVRSNIYVYQPRQISFSLLHKSTFLLFAWIWEEYTWDLTKKYTTNQGFDKEKDKSETAVWIRLSAHGLFFISSYTAQLLLARFKVTF